MTSKSRPEVDVTGRCACGAIEMALHGTVHSMLLCACSDCQKATGTGHATVALARREDLRVSGEVHSHARTADSGATFTRHFCPVCGTPLYGVSSRWPQAVMLPIGFFGEHADWFAPNQLIFSRSLRHWDSMPDQLPRHETYRERQG